MPIYGAEGPINPTAICTCSTARRARSTCRSRSSIDGYANPALGDIDGDGLVEIVTIRSEVGNVINGHVVALEHDGTLKWENTTIYDAWQIAVALADLDADGDVEIMARRASCSITTATRCGKRPDNGAIDTHRVAADLDGDGDLEVVLGPNAYHHDGSVYYDVAAVGISHPQVANLDDDPEPEVLLAGGSTA